jgi:hypothetical protein
MAFAVLAAAVLAGPSAAPACAADAQPSGFSVSLRTDRAVYRVGEPIPVTLEIAGGDDGAIRFDFPNAQRFDFVVENAEGAEVWRWSWGQMFAAMLGQETLEPGHDRLTYRAEIDADLPAGLYTVRGVLTDAHKSAAAELVVKVE